MSTCGTGQSLRAVSCQSQLFGMKLAWIDLLPYSFVTIYRIMLDTYRTGLPQRNRDYEKLLLTVKGRRWKRTTYVYILACCLALLTLLLI